MLRLLCRSDDLIKIVKNTTSLKELKFLQKQLSDEKATVMLRDSHVYEALKEIPKQAKRIDVKEAISDLIDLLF